MNSAHDNDFIETWRAPLPPSRPEYTYSIFPCDPGTPSREVRRYGSRLSDRKTAKGALRQAPHEAKKAARDMDTPLPSGYVWVLVFKDGVFVLEGGASV